MTDINPYRSDSESISQAKFDSYAFDEIKIIHTRLGVKHICAGLIIHYRDKILLIPDDQDQTKYTLPRRHLKLTESPEEAAARISQDLLDLENTSTTLLGQVEIIEKKNNCSADIEEWTIFEIYLDHRDQQNKVNYHSYNWVSTKSIQSDLFTNQTYNGLRKLGLIE